MKIFSVCVEVVIVVGGPRCDPQCELACVHCSHPWRRSTTTPARACRWPSRRAPAAPKIEGSVGCGDLHPVSPRTEGRRASLPVTCMTQIGKRTWSATPLHAAHTWSCVQEVVRMPLLWSLLPFPSVPSVPVSACRTV